MDNTFIKRRRRLIRETPAENAHALLLALGLHALLFGLLFVELLWTRPSPKNAVSGPPVSASLVDAGTLSEAMQRTLAERPDRAVGPEAMPHPSSKPVRSEPQPSEPQAIISAPQKQSKDALLDQSLPSPDRQADVREFQHRQEQVELTNSYRQLGVHQQQGLTRLEAERLAQLDNIRRQRVSASGEAEAAEQRLKRIAAAGALSASDSMARGDANPPLDGTDSARLQARYAEALQDAISAKWKRPEMVPVGARCRLIIRQLPGGEVMGTEVSSSCAYDEQGRRSIEAAVRMAQPLPYKGFEPAFARTTILNFEARDR